MRKTWLIFVSSLQRTRALIIASLFIGVILCLITAAFSNITPGVAGTIKIGYIDNDNSALARDFELYATEHLGMELVKGEEDFLNNELVEKRVSAIVEVPSGLEAAVLTGSEGSLLVTSMDDYINKVFLQNYLELYMTSVEMLAGAANGDADELASLLEDAQSAAAPVTTANLDELQFQHEKDWIAFLVGIGFFVFLASIVITFLATIVYDDRVNNTLKRVQASNVHTISYVIGVCAAGFSASLVMIIVFLGFCALRGFGSDIPLGIVAVLCTLYALYCVAFALACGLFFKSRNSIMWAAIAVSTTFSMVGGAFFPITYSPAFIQKLAHGTPSFWLVDTIYAMKDGDMSTWVFAGGILLLFSLLFFLIAGVQFASRNRST